MRFGSVTIGHGSEATPPFDNQIIAYLASGAVPAGRNSTANGTLRGGRAAATARPQGLGPCSKRQPGARHRRTRRPPSGASTALPVAVRRLVALLRSDHIYQHIISIIFGRSPPSVHGLKTPAGDSEYGACVPELVRRSDVASRSRDLYLDRMLLL